MDLVPCFERIIVKRKEMEKTSGGLYIPQSSKEMQATEGEVIAVGPQCTTIKVGDTVFFGKYSGAEMEREGFKFVLMNEEDVLCTVRTTPEGAKEA